MTAPRDCRPPENTPDGTVCWLQDGSGFRAPAIWRDRVGGYWGWPVVNCARPPEWVARYGWRFHSIAEPPHE